MHMRLITVKTLGLTMLTGVLLISTVLLSSGQVVRDTRVAWKDDLVTIEWTEPLADARAARDEVPFTVLTGPYIGWLTSTEATIGWEVIAEKSVTVKPYASLSATYPSERIQFRTVRLTD